MNVTAYLFKCQTRKKPEMKYANCSLHFPQYCVKDNAGNYDI